MKLKSLAIILASAAFFSGSAMAADGTITFKGAVTDQTCTVDPNDAKQTVTLGTVGTSAFKVAGDRAPTIAFDIKLTNCPAAQENVWINFQAAPDAVNPKLIAIPASSGNAKGIGLGITDRRTGNLIPPMKYSEKFPIDKNSKSGTITLAANYVSTTDKVTPGDANVTSDFTIAYK